MISDVELQKALHEYQEWGEKLRTPRDVRIAALLPRLTSHEIQEVLATCKAVEDFSWDMATAVRDKGMTQEEAKERIRLQFPFMSGENLSRTYSQAMYYTLK